MDNDNSIFAHVNEPNNAQLLIVQQRAISDAYYSEFPKLPTINLWSTENNRNEAWELKPIINVKSTRLISAAWELYTASSSLTFFVHDSPFLFDLVPPTRRPNATNSSLQDPVGSPKTFRFSLVAKQMILRSLKPLSGDITVLDTLHSDQPNLRTNIEKEKGKLLMTHEEAYKERNKK